MFEIELNDNYQEVGCLQGCARRQYATLAEAKDACGTVARVTRVPKRDEWKLQIGVYRREIGRVRKIEEAKPVAAPKPARFRVARNVAVALAALIGLSWR